MNRPLTALLAALESLLAVGIGIGSLLVPLTALWAFQYGLAVDWTVFYRAAADAWLLGHGVDVRFVLDPALAASLGLPGAGDPFVVTIAALGLALVTGLLAARTGSRLRETDHPRLGVAVSIAAFAALAAVIVLTAGTGAAQPSRWQGVLLPTLVFAAGVAAGWSFRGRGTGLPLLERAGVPADWALLLREAFRIGLASIAGLMVVASLAVAFLLVLGYSTVISLYESLQGGVLGGAALTLGQLALLPDLVVWAASWLVGPGFSLGTGSSVSPLGTALGPVPGLPVLGALPAGQFAWGFLGLLVPLVLAFLCGAVLRPRLDRALLVPPAPLELVMVGAIAGATGGIVLGVLAWAASGTAGPGRLASVGPDAFVVGLLAAVEIAVAASLGLLAGRPRAEVVENDTAPLTFEVRR